MLKKKKKKNPGASIAFALCIPAGFFPLDPIRVLEQALGPYAMRLLRVWHFALTMLRGITSLNVIPGSVSIRCR